MSGRLIVSYEPSVIPSMLGMPVETTLDKVSFANLILRGIQLYVIEDEQGIAAAATFTAPQPIEVVLGYTWWIREDLRGKTTLTDDLIQGLLDVTGRTLLLIQLHPKILEGRTNLLPLPTTDEAVKIGVTPAYFHEGVYIHARSPSRASDSG